MLANFQAGGKEGLALDFVPKNPPRKLKNMRVCSPNAQEYPARSPFAKQGTMRDFMKAKLVNNNIFHEEFDGSIASKDNLAVCSELFGHKEAHRLGSVTEDFDKRYFQKYPGQQKKDKKE